MSKRPSKKGLPKALQAEEDELQGKAHEPTIEQFVNEMHGEGTTSTPIDGIETKEWLQDTFKTKSAIIRYLTSKNHSVKDIAKHLGMRYQHVRNVSKAELKRGPNEDWRKPYLEGSGIPNVKDFKPKSV